MMRTTKTKCAAGFHAALCTISIMFSDQQRNHHLHFLRMRCISWSVDLAELLSPDASAVVAAATACACAAEVLSEHCCAGLTATALQILSAAKADTISST